MWHMRYSSLFLYFCPSKCMPFKKSVSFSLKRLHRLNLTSDILLCLFHLVECSVNSFANPFISLNQEINNLLSLFFFFFVKYSEILNSTSPTPHPSLDILNTVTIYLTFHQVLVCFLFFFPIAIEK